MDSTTDYWTGRTLPIAYAATVGPQPLKTESPSFERVACAPSGHAFGVDVCMASHPTVRRRVLVVSCTRGSRSLRRCGTPLDLVPTSYTENETVQVFQMCLDLQRTVTCTKCRLHTKPQGQVEHCLYAVHMGRNETKRNGHSQSACK